ncbi:hypothetical protein COLO4_07893 [Corchorus olitorius]|uniref:Uncharacterized protein n=1 Tax=Corchorus olitorius TaxID=93759 RepID=A0A1R3KI84_9ROSI|nr:hypothetical protein COLO4_07893 [Corchorus olitorius]
MAFSSHKSVIWSGFNILIRAIEKNPNHKYAMKRRWFYKRSVE